MKVSKILSTLKSQIAPPFALMLVATPLLAGSYTTKIQDYPVQPDASCDLLARDTGQRLVEYARANLRREITVTRATCYSDYSTELPRWNIELTYSADAPLNRVAAGRAGSAYSAVYPSEGECLAALEFERTMFETNTGLQPFTSYCRVPMFKDLGWDLEIIAYGQAARLPRTVSTEIFGSVQNHTRESFITMVANHIGEDGSQVAHAVLLNHFPAKNITVRYYGDRDLSLSELDLVETANAETCVARAAQIGADLHSAGYREFGTYCSQNIVDRSRYIVTTIVPNDSDLGLIMTPPQYKEAADCESVIPGVVAHYRDDLRRDITSAYCSLNEQAAKYQVVLFERL